MLSPDSKRRAADICGPRVARVSIGTLREIAEVLDGHGEVEQIERLRLDLDYLIDSAHWTGARL